MIEENVPSSVTNLLYCLPVDLTENQAMHKQRKPAVFGKKSKIYLQSRFNCHI